MAGEGSAFCFPNLPSLKGSSDSSLPPQLQGELEPLSAFPPLPLPYGLLALWTFAYPLPE